jgi:hypothetical protein
MIQQFCANESCRWHRERRGGTFELREGELYCEDCIAARRLAPLIGSTCANLWDFTTTHFNGEPIHVTSLNHLRQLEKQYGCSNHTANFMEKDWNTPPPVKPMPENRQLAEMTRYYTEPERRR